MKKKKMSKKLLLNKETVSHLNLQEMDEVRGGDPPTTMGTVLPCQTELITAAVSWFFSCSICPLC